MFLGSWHWIGWIRSGLLNYALSKLFDPVEVISCYFRHDSSSAELYIEAVSVFVFGHLSFIANLEWAHVSSLSYMLVANWLEPFRRLLTVLNAVDRDEHVL